MPMYRLTMYFTHPAGGWSEFLYKSAADLSVAIATAKYVADQRQKLIAKPTTLFTIKAQNDANARESRITRYNGTYQPWITGSDFPTTAARYYLFGGTSGINRNLWLRGGPDALYDENIPVNPDATLWENKFATSWRPMFGGADDQDFQIKYKLKTSSQPKRDVSNYEATATRGIVKVTTSLLQPHGLLPGDLCTFYKMPNLNPGPGLSRVSGVEDANIFYVSRQIPANYLYTKGGFIRKYAFDYQGITSLAFAEWGEKRVGRPFGLPRGARRKTPK